MVIQFVRITTTLVCEEVRRTIEEWAPRLREVPGMLQKYYGNDPDSGSYCGCYLFDSEGSWRAFRRSGLARTIPAAYQAEDLRVESYEVLFPLHEELLLAGQAPGASTDKTIRPTAWRADSMQYAATSSGAEALTHGPALWRRVFCVEGEGWGNPAFTHGTTNLNICPAWVGVLRKSRVERPV